MGVIAPERDPARLSEFLGEDCLHTKNDNKLRFARRAASFNSSCHREPTPVPITGVVQRHELNLQFARPVKCSMSVPKRTARSGLDEPRRACSGKGFRELSRPVNPDHEEWQATLTYTLQGGQTMCQLLEAHTEAPFEYRKIVTGCLARSKKSAVRHKQSRCDITGQMPDEESAGSLVVKFRPLRDRFDSICEFELRDLECELEVARCVAEHFRQLNLPRMEIQTAQTVRHDFLRKKTNGKLVPFAQAFDQRDTNIPARQTHIIGQLFGRSVQISKVIAPAFDLTARCCQRLQHFRRSVPRVVIKAGKGSSRLGSCGEKFLQLFPIDAEITKAFVGKSARQAIDPTDRLMFAQTFRIEVELFD